MSATSRQRQDSRRSAVTERARKTLRLDLIPNADVGEMVKRAREAEEWERRK